MPTISVVMPVFNGERFIGKAIQSACQQTCPPLEIIVVDDGSTDRTAALVHTFQSTVLLSYLRQPNQGQAAALNRGVSVARGTWVAFLDADDVWYPDKLAVLAECIEACPQTPFLYSAMDCIDEAGRFVPSPKWITKPDPLFRDQPFAFPSTVLVRKDVIAECGGFHPSLRLLNDWELFMRIARAYPIHRTPRSLIQYRRYSAQTSKDKRLWIDCLPLYYQCASELWRDDPSKQAILSRRTAAVYADLGRHYLRAGDYATARQMCRLSFSFRPWSWTNLRRWGLSYLPGAREWYRYRKMTPHAY